MLGQGVGDVRAGQRSHELTGRAAEPDLKGCVGAAVGQPLVGARKLSVEAVVEGRLLEAGDRPSLRHQVSSRASFSSLGLNVFTYRFVQSTSFRRTSATLFSRMGPGNLLSVRIQ